jgi:Putative Ig domain
MPVFNPWTVLSGYDLGSHAEGTSVDISLPINVQTGITFSVISGVVPSGLAIRYLSGAWKLIGTPFLTTNNTDFSFCIRASNGVSISDRTFKIVVYNVGLPEFITPAGELPVGIGGQYYVMDNSYISFQLDAFDYNDTTGQPLRYYIADNDGTLPPGVTLSSTGLVSGFIKPVLQISIGDGSGNFDESLFDKVGFDFGKSPTNGYDSFKYDSVFYDYNDLSTTPQSLSANYQFRVTLTDGISSTQRIFRIYVAGSDEFRADSTTLDGQAGDFNADSSFIRAPVWITESNLGVFRANNYITIPVALYDDNNVVFGIEDETALPPGLRFDPNGGDLYGVVPYQPSVSKSYSFTLTATRYEEDESVTATKTFTMVLLGDVTSQILWSTPSNLGSIPANYVCTLSVLATSTVPNSTVSYVISDGALPNGLSLNLDGEIIGTPVQYYDPVNHIKGLTTIDRDTTTFDHNTITFDHVYKFSITAQDQYGYSDVTRKFTLRVTTPNTTSYSNITAKPLLIPGQRLLWKDFINNSTIFPSSSIYRPNDPNFGLRTDLNMLVYAGIETKLAAAYVGAMGLGIKKKRFQFGSIKTAVATDTVTDQAVYEVVYIQMIDPLEPDGKHLPLSIKVSNPTSQVISTDASNSIWSLNLADLTADAPSSSRPAYNITADSTGYTAGNPNTDTYYPNSITNWQERLKPVGLNERNYLPLWMRSIPMGTKEELGYVLCVPLCFCKVGTSSTIVTNIKKLSGFDFKSIDFTIDRFTITAVLNSSDQVVQSDKYLVFRNDRITV